MGLLEEGLNHQGHIFMTGDQRIFFGSETLVKRIFLGLQ